MLVITGATGNTGSAAAEVLLAARRPVRVVVRDPKDAERWKSRGARVEVAGFEDTAAMARAFDGAEGIYLLLPPFNPNETRLAESRRILRESLVAAVKRAKPRHVVFLSSMGAQHASGTGPIVFLHDFEQDLAVSGVPATFLRAAFFMQNLAPMVPAALQTGVLYTGQIPDRAFPVVAARDIGAVAADLLLDPVQSGTRVLQLAGPKEYSTEDAAATLARITGRPVQAVQLSPEALGKTVMGRGASKEVADLVVEMTGALNSGLAAWDGRSAIHRRGIVPLEAVLRDIVRSATETAGAQRTR
jgi:uncharacterized protein YbjT (DUF2867 family)